MFGEEPELFSVLISRRTGCILVTWLTAAFSFSGYIRGCTLASSAASRISFSPGSTRSNSFILALSSERSFICIRPSTDTTSITLTGSDSRKAIVSFMASFAVQLSIFTSKTLIFSFISSPANSFPSFSIIANGYSLFNLYYTIFTLINIRNTFVIFFIFPFLFRDQPSDSTGFLGCK